MNATVQALREEQAKKVAANLSDIGEVLAHMDYADCAATYDYSQGVSPTDVRLVFVGPSDRHSLDVLSSDRERVLAHWHGFVEKNGGGWAQIGHLCTGLRDDPATSYLDGIAAGLDVDLDWLAGGRGEEPSVEHLRAAGERYRDDLAAANATPAPADVADAPTVAA